MLLTVVYRNLLFMRKVVADSLVLWGLVARYEILSHCWWRDVHSPALSVVNEMKVQW